MIVRLSSSFHKKLKRLDVRIRNRFQERILLFIKNPTDPILDNHPLERELIGYRSIDITANYRVVFEELQEGNETIYFFFLIGTHKELYKPTEKQ